MKGVRLSGVDREFFAGLLNAITMNPFSRERANLMRELGSTEAGNAWSIDTHAYDMAAEVNRRTDRLERGGGRSLDDFAPADRPMMELVFLYQLYHRLIPEFDAFIATQLRDPGARRTVPFAREATLPRRGLCAPSTA